MRNIFSWGTLLKHRTTLLITTLLLADLVLAVIFALSYTVDVPTNHLDGAYQTASGLHRLAEGQWPGRDFYPYLGVGLLYFLYPVFLLAGSNVIASVFAAYFTITFAGAFSVGLIGALIAKSQRLLIGILLGSLTLGLVIWPFPYLPQEMISLFSPGTSLRPLRAFLPYLSTAIVYVLLASRLRPLFISSGIGGVAGAAFLWSNDYGIPTSGLLILFALVWAHRSGNLSLKSGMAVLGSAFFVAAFGLMLATKGHGVDLLRYNFIDVAGDQYWYFYDWSANSRILSVADFFTKFVAPVIGWWGLVLVGMFVLTYFRPSMENILLLIVGLALAGGGTVASVGGHLEGDYLTPFIFWCKATLIIGLVFFILSVAGITRLRVTLLSWITNIAILGTIALLLVLIVKNLEANKARRVYAQSDPGRFFVSELGGYLPNEWKSHINLARDSKEVPVIEEYWGIWSAVSKKRVPLPTDSVIHALGAKRERFATILQELPELIVTSAPDKIWHGWNISANWWFYKIVLEHYEPTQTSPLTYLWKKTAQRSNWPTTDCHVAGDPLKPLIVIAASTPGYYEITLQYQASGLSSRSLLFVKNKLNSAFDGYLSLDPLAKTIIFPAALGGSEDQSLDFKLTTASDDLSKVLIQGCQAKRIVFSSQPLGVLPPMSLAPADASYDLTDQGWINGVARSWAGFFVSNTVANRNNLTQGKKIRFADGQIREVVRQDENGAYLNIVLDGAPLDGNLVGFPHQFRVLPPQPKFNSDSNPINLTDQNWTNGVAKSWAGFFVNNTLVNRNNLTPGEKIQFADGQIRTITRQEENGAYLNIVLDGLPLDGNVVGFPHKFRVKK